MLKMTEQITLEQIDETCHLLRSKIKQNPGIGLILGSGLGSLADQVQDPVIIPYTEIPNWPVSTVQGHQGCLVSGNLEGQQVLVMQGRAHYYEGYSMAQITLPVRVMQRLGITTMFITNAAGAINPDFNAGEVMLIIDHLNLIGMAGLNPLRGPNRSELGPRFPDMSIPYDRELRALALDVANQNRIRLHQGVYAGLAGPSFESPADLRFLRTAGADAVGMSTVPEVIVARHGGLRVLGFSGISNKANLDGSTITTHEEVLAAGEMITPQLLTLIRGVLWNLAD
jgi:purine-nucleoside phosphorylase